MTRKREAMVVILILITHIVAKCILTVDATGPLIYNDELIYKTNAASIFNGGPIDTDRYPPLYSISLLPAFFSPQNWYPWMLFINVLISSAAGFVFYAISRRFLQRAETFAALSLFLLWPFHVAYPRLLMSENLHVPLFLIVFYLTLIPKEAKTQHRPIYSMLLGACMALAFLTKFLFLVAIPVIVFLWSLQPFFIWGKPIRSVLQQRRIIEIVLMAGAFILVYAIWLTYARYSGFNTYQAIGGRFISAIKDFSTFESLILWIKIYIAYCFFLFGPFLFPIGVVLALLACGKIRLERQEAFLWIAVALLLCVYIATATQHSWRAKYNYPYPQRVLGRYLLHLWPMCLILTFTAIEKVKRFRDKITPALVAVLTTLIIAGFLWSAWTLFGRHDWQLKFSFINSPEAALYQFRIFRLAVLAGIVILMVSIWLGRHSRLFDRFLKYFFILFLLGIQLIGCYGAYHFCTIRSLDALHGRKIAEFLKNNREQKNQKTVIVYDLPESSKYFHRNFLGSLKFWLSLPRKSKSLEVLPIAEYFDNQRTFAGRTYYLSTRELGKPVYRYQSTKRSFVGQKFLVDRVQNRYPILKTAQNDQTYFLYLSE